MTEPTERALALASEALPCNRYSKRESWCKQADGLCCTCASRPAVARVIQGVMDEHGQLAGGQTVSKNVYMEMVAERDGAIARQNQLLLSCQKAEAERDALKREVEHERQRLAAVGVLAHSRNEAQLAGMLPEYESDALAGVRALVREVERLGEPALLAANKVLIAEFDLLKADYNKLRARDQRIRELTRAYMDSGNSALLYDLTDAIEETP